MQEHIYNLAPDELRDLRDMHTLALMTGDFDSDEIEDLATEISLIDREISRRPL